MRKIGTRKKLVPAVCAALLGIGGMIVGVMPDTSQAVAAAAWENVRFAEALLHRGNVILLDPGHGGIDGGAQSWDGVCEKDINLSISKKVKDILEDYDVPVLMTRETDCGLYSEGKSSVRAKKNEDLRARLELAHRYQPAAMISIHLNSFREDRSAFGAQTFFTTAVGTEAAEKSRSLAELIQKALTEKIANGNTRTAMEKNDVLIMKEAEVPTVIVECGFLSNKEEAAKMQQAAYQKTLAEAISDGILTYLGIEKRDVKKASIKFIASK